MNSKRIKSLFEILRAISLILFIPWFLFAGTTGKIAGVVKDKDTGDALPAVNVIIEGTLIGAATDVNGYYFIINVSPGTYRLKASMMGYNELIVRNVRVTVDLTATIDFEMESKVLDLGKTVIVTAERPLIRPDITSKTTTYTSAIIENMPVNTIQDIMSLQSGVVEMASLNKIGGFEARGIDQVHVRGGRSGQIAYMVDGMYVEDAVYSGMGTSINREAIEELTVITGNFNAEYGEAQSAIVNIVTKEGTQRYSGSFEFNSGEIAGVLGSERDDIRDRHQIIGSFGGPVPLIKGMRFFISGEQSFRRYNVLEFDQHTYDPTELNWLLDNPEHPRYQQIVDQISEGVITEVDDIQQLRNNSKYRYVGDVLRHKATGCWRKAWAYKNDWGDDRLPNTHDPGEGDDIDDLVRWDDKAGWRALGFYKNSGITGKLSWRISPSIKLMMLYRNTGRIFKATEWSWQYAEKGYNVILDKTDQQGITLTHQVSNNLFYEINANRFWKSRTYRVKGIGGHELTAGHADIIRDSFLQDWKRQFRDEHGRRPTEEEIQQEMERISQYWPSTPQEYSGYSSHGGFLDDLVFAGYDTLVDGTIRQVYLGSSCPFWTRTLQQSMGLSAAVTWQIHRYHQLKFGTEYKKFGFDEKLFGKETTGIYFLEMQRPWRDKPFFEYYHIHPLEFSAYLQDKMEYEIIIVNAGVRIDLADSKGYAFNDWADPTSPVKKGRKKYQISPRLGIGYPITDRNTLHFSYGHFFQIPDYRDLYQNQPLNVRTGLVGWAHMDAARTVAMEIGVDQQIGDFWRVGIALWNKENNGEPGSYLIAGFDPDSLGSYDYYTIHNTDYGSSKGIDISIEKRFSDNYFGTIEYTYSVAKANRYYSWAGYWSGDTEENRPKKEYLLPWNRPHVIDANIGYSMPKNFGPPILGFRPLQNMTWQFIVHTGSGMPYTPYVGSIALEPNTGSKPWTTSIDAVIRKDYYTSKEVSVGILFRIRNLLDRKNILRVYSRTGSATDPGPSMSKTVTSTYYDRPHWFGKRRRIDIGIKIRF